MRGKPLQLCRRGTQQQLSKGLHALAFTGTVREEQQPSFKYYQELVKTKTTSKFYCQVEKASLTPHCTHDHPVMFPVRTDTQSSSFSELCFHHSRELHSQRQNSGVVKGLKNPLWYSNTEVRRWRGSSRMHTRRARVYVYHIIWSQCLPQCSLSPCSVTHPHRSHTINKTKSQVQNGSFHREHILTLTTRVNEHIIGSHRQEETRGS